MKNYSHLSVRRPPDQVSHLVQVCDVGRPALDEVPGDELPVLGHGEGQLARGVHAHVGDAVGVLHQGLLHLPVLGAEDAEKGLEKVR